MNIFDDEYRQSAWDGRIEEAEKEKREPNKLRHRTFTKFDVKSDGLTAVAG